jgi:hypothetical protein
VSPAICMNEAYTGQLIAAVAFPDWAAYGKGMQAAMVDPDYQRLLAETSKTFELQDRSVFVGEDV